MRSVVLDLRIDSTGRVDETGMNIFIWAIFLGRNQVHCAPFVL